MNIDDYLMFDNLLKIIQLQLLYRINYKMYMYSNPGDADGLLADRLPPLAIFRFI